MFLLFYIKTGGKVKNPNLFSMKQNLWIFKIYSSN